MGAEWEWGAWPGCCEEEEDTCLNVCSALKTTDEVKVTIPGDFIDWTAPCGGGECSGIEGDYYLTWKGGETWEYFEQFCMDEWGYVYNLTITFLLECIPSVPPAEPEEVTHCRAWVEIEIHCGRHDTPSGDEWWLYDSGEYEVEKKSEWELAYHSQFFDACPVCWPAFYPDSVTAAKA